MAKAKQIQAFTGVVALALAALSCGSVPQSRHNVSDSDLSRAATVALPQIEIMGDEDNDSDKRLHEPPDLDQTPDYPTEPFGRVADAADTAMATALVTRYYADAARGDGGAACRLLTQARAEAAAQEDGASVAVPGKRCAHTLSRLFAQQRKRLRAENAGLRVAAVRVEFNRASVRLRLAHSRTAHYIGLHRERGVWKVETLLDDDHPVFVE